MDDIIVVQMANELARKRDIIKLLAGAWHLSMIAFAEQGQLNASVAIT